MTFAIKRLTPPLNDTYFHPFLPHFFPFAIESYLYDKDFHLLLLPIIILKSSYINWFKIDNYWYIQPWLFSILSIFFHFL